MIESEVILASAGTGKTHALTSRLLRLLALGVRPDAIIALTFTRKAAGEFAVTIFRRLARAAGDPESARRLAHELDLQDADVTRFAALLADLVRAMESLQFRTFDAFFQRIVSAMPFELGLPGGVQLLGENDAAELRDRVLTRLLAADHDPAAQAALLEAYRDATAGAEEKGLRRKLETFIADHHAHFLTTRDPNRWGGHETIWPRGCDWLGHSTDIAEDAQTLETWARAQDGEVFRSLESLALETAAWQPGMPLPKGRVFEQLLEQFAADPAATALTITFRKRDTLVDSSMVAPLRRLVTRLIGASLQRHLRVTAGIRRVLEPFDATYHEEVRLSGRLAFADVLEMLRRIPAIEWQARLDARLDHWLFDEFQDTSLSQWSVVENLVDEVLQDDSGRRSAFFVGDPKQSIYRWRGGEHRLLEHILAHYGGHLRERTLVKSYRSDPALIELINRYGAAAADSANGLPAAIVAEWSRFWALHESAAVDRIGHATVQQLDDEDDLPERVLAELARIDPIRRGLTCAVLTRDNDSARELAAALRERGFLQVTAETDEAIATDAPVNRGLLALLTAIAHPADDASRHLVEMSPLHALLDEGGWPGLRTRLFRQVTAEGIEISLREMVARLPTGGPADDFSRQRLGLLFDLARTHDATGGSLRDFLMAATTHRRRQVASTSNVQILTIHRSKGLGFDIVLLPVFDKSRMDGSSGADFLAPRGPSLETEWLLHRPVVAVSAMDPVLRAAHEQQVQDDAYDALCVWYVGLTRAKHALHVFTVAPGKSSGTSPVSLLYRAIGPTDPTPDGRLWEAGKPDWFESNQK